MMKRACLLITVLPLALGGCTGARNWYADTPMSNQDRSQQAHQLSPQDRDLKVAMDVVQTRLREADETGDYASLRSVQPQLYRLANALLPHASAPQNLQQPVQATKSKSPAPQQGAMTPPAHAHLQNATHAMPVPAPQPAPASSRVQQPAQQQPFSGAQVQPAAMHKPVPLAGAYAPAPMLANSRSLYHAVQLGAYRSEARAMDGWHELQARAGQDLSGLSTRTERVDLGSKGVFYRLKAGPFASREKAMSRCRELAASGIACLGTDFTGRPAG